MKLSILRYGDRVLRAKGKRIEQVDDRIRELATNMLETMHAANGIGLAAQQIGQPLQLTVIDISQVEDRPSTMKLNGKEIDPKTAMPLVLINPALELRGSETEVGVEGCLSFPEISGEIERAQSVLARAQTLNGAIEFEAGGLLARALQHEVDHLNGILFIDRMNSAARAALSGQLKRLQKEAKRGQRIRAKDRQFEPSETAM